MQYAQKTCQSQKENAYEILGLCSYPKKTVTKFSRVFNPYNMS